MQVKKFFSLRYNLWLKLLVVFMLSLLLLIPREMIEQLVWERSYTQQLAIEEVGEKWGLSQVVGGPYLVIPYREKREEVTEVNLGESVREDVRVTYHWRNWIVMPHNLRYGVQIEPEVRHRGIYEVVLYRSQFTIMGDLELPDPQRLGIDTSLADWSRARWVIRISDTKGIQSAELRVNGEEMQLVSGDIPDPNVYSGVSAPALGIRAGMPKQPFELNMSLNGSMMLHVLPLGQTTSVSMYGEWPSPSFDGKFLPDSSRLGNQFEAWWNILHLNRNFPETWVDGEYYIDDHAFGLTLFSPVDHYQKTDRSIKYAYMFIVLTFISLFFIEIYRKVFVHPMQYLLMGLALVIFYTLLLSISEHWTFNWAYIVSVFATIMLISGYIHAVLKSKQMSGLLAGILVILYSFIFIILQLEDHALLIGSIGMFLILALIMYFSRKIDWSLGAET